jgi:hypothetical protein
MINRALLEKLSQRGPEQVMDGFELSPSCDGLSPGIAKDGETIMHCPVCHDQNAVTLTVGGTRCASGTGGRVVVQTKSTSNWRRRDR